jgi:hypothetical protein
MIDALAYGIVVAGVVLVIGLTLGAGCLASYIWGSIFWFRIRRIYRLHTVWHYLKKLEATGRYHFPPPDEENP